MSCKVKIVNDMPETIGSKGTFTTFRVGEIVDVSKVKVMMPNGRHHVQYLAISNNMDIPTSVAEEIGNCKFDKTSYHKIREFALIVLQRIFPFVIFFGIIAIIMSTFRNRKK